MITQNHTKSHKKLKQIISIASCGGCPKGQPLPFCSCCTSNSQEFQMNQSSPRYLEPDLRTLSLPATTPLSWIAFVMPTSSERRQGRKSLAMQAKVKLNRDYLIRFHHHSSRLLCQQATRGKEEGNFSPCCNLESYHYLLQPTTCRLCCNLESYYYLLQPTTC